MTSSKPSDPAELGAEFGTCCVCEQPCRAGERLTVGDPECLVRHTACKRPEKPSGWPRERP